MRKFVVGVLWLELQSLRPDIMVTSLGVELLSAYRREEGSGQSRYLIELPYYITKVYLGMHIRKIYHMVVSIPETSTTHD